MTTECPTHPLTPMPITDRSSDIRIYLLNVTLVLNASAAKLAALCRDTCTNWIYQVESNCSDPTREGNSTTGTLILTAPTF